MLRKNINGAVVATLIGMLPALSLAAPVTMGFEGQVADTDSMTPVTPYVESGFTLTNLYPQSINDGIFGKSFSGGNSNGSAYFSFCAYDGGRCLDNTAIRLTAASPFTLSSIDVGLFSATDPVGTLELIGTLVGGGSVSATLNVGGAWTTNALSGFSNLQGLEFRGHGTYATSIDNLVLDYFTGSNRVPEPGSLALCAIALGALGLRGKRRT